MSELTGWFDADGHPVWPMTVRSPAFGPVPGWKRRSGSWRRCRCKGSRGSGITASDEIVFEEVVS